MEKLGIIEKQYDLTPWVSDMATALKSNGEMRLCIDPQHLNKSNTEGTLPYENH